MNNRYEFREEEASRIVARFGQSFCDKLPQTLETHAARWELTEFELIPSYSANLVFACRSPRYGDAVMKIGGAGPREMRAEYETLRQYGGRRFCSVYEANFDDLVLLEERVRPGTPLRDEPELLRRLDVFCSLYRDMHVAPADEEHFATYASWVGNIASYMRERHRDSRMNAHMRQANAIYRELAAEYTGQMLLHGDFHHDNMLIGNDGAYRIIDPKGVIGDPVFDIPRFVLNEFGDETDAAAAARIDTSIETIARNLQYPIGVIRRCLYVETAMGLCWQVQDGADADDPDLVRFADFAASLMRRSDA